MTHHPGTEDSSLIEDIHDFLSLHIDVLIFYLLDSVNETAHVLFCSTNPSATLHHEGLSML